MPFLLYKVSNDSGFSPPLFSSPPAQHSPPSISSPPSACSEHDTISVSSDISASSATSLLRRKEISIPKKWKPSITLAIADKKLNPEVRNEIVRDLVTHMYGQVDKPDPSLAANVANLLVARYPFCYWFRISSFSKYTYHAGGTFIMVIHTFLGIMAEKDHGSCLQCRKKPEAQSI